jgi:putative phage-type endonuclease
MEKYKVVKFKDEFDWLLSRREKITGTLISAIIGENPYMTNVQAYHLLMQDKMFEKENISDKPQVIYGKKAEPLIRRLFALDHPEYQVIDPVEDAYEIYESIEHPFMSGTLDGTLIDKEGKKGVLEIKTSEILTSRHKEQWSNGNVPPNYYCQVLWYMLITGYEFAVLHAQLKYRDKGEVWTTRRDYMFKLEDVKEDIEFIKQKGIEFWNENYLKRKEPKLLVKI